MFQETLLEDEADLEAQLAALQAAQPKTAAAPKAPRKRPRRQALPENLRRVEHHHEPESTACATQDCGQQMTRVGGDVSERLDIVPAEFLRSTATSTASGRAAAASARGSSAWCRSQPIRRSSMAASLPAGSLPTR
jgi:transposase